MKTKVAHSKKIIHVLPLGNGWAVRTSGSEKFIVITVTKYEAVSAGKAMAKSYHGSLIIYGKDGQITERNSYTKNTTYPIATDTHSKAREPQTVSQGRYSRARKKK